MGFSNQETTKESRKIHQLSIPLKDVQYSKPMLSVYDQVVLAEQGGNQVWKLKTGETVLRAKDYLKRDGYRPLAYSAFMFEPNMWIYEHSLTFRIKGISEANPPTVQLFGCNLDCPYCFNPNSDEHTVHHLTGAQIDEMLDMIEDMKVIRISGGEPFLWGDSRGWKQLISGIDHLQFQTVIDTNLTCELPRLLPRYASSLVFGCFKGFTPDDIIVGKAYDEASLARLLDKQFQIARKLWYNSLITVVLFWVPVLPGATRDGVVDFIQRLRSDIHPLAPYATIPIQVHSYGTNSGRWKVSEEESWDKFREVRDWWWDALGIRPQDYLPMWKRGHFPIRLSRVKA